MNDNANVNVSDKKDKEIENLKKQLDAANTSWNRYFQECETLKQELSRYKELRKGSECYYKQQLISPGQPIVTVAIYIGCSGKGSVVRVVRSQSAKLGTRVRIPHRPQNLNFNKNEIQSRRQSNN